MGLVRVSMEGLYKFFDSLNIASRPLFRVLHRTSSRFADTSSSPFPRGPRTSKYHILSQRLSYITTIPNPST